MGWKAHAVSRYAEPYQPMSGVDWNSRVISGMACQDAGQQLGREGRAEPGGPSRLTVEMMVRSSEMRNTASIRPTTMHASGNPVTYPASSSAGVSGACSDISSLSDQTVALSDPIWLVRVEIDNVFVDSLASAGSSCAVSEQIISLASQMHRISYLGVVRSLVHEILREIAPVR